MKKFLFVGSVFAALSALSIHAFSTEAFSLNFVAPAINGKENVANPIQGEIVYDTSDSTFYGRNSASWSALGVSPEVVPAGVILPYGGATAPTGYLFADGSAVSRTSYAALFAAIGTSFGSGNGSTTFNLPDLRGRFVRGVDGTAGRDPDKASRVVMATGGNSGNNVGSVQGHAIQEHTHVIYGTSVATPGASSTIVGNTVNGSGSATNTYVTQNSGAIGSFSSETRPMNAYVNFIIKY